MIIKEDICPKTGLKREIEFVKIEDNLSLKKIFLDCNINYYHNNVFLGTNLFETDKTLLTLSNENTLDGIGEYDYWKGLLNDFSAMNSRNIVSFDSYCAYIIMKAYLDGKFN